MRKVTFTPSSLDRYATNGVQRSVTPEAFSAGTTAKVSSGYLAFHSCAEALVAIKASAAAPARMNRRLIMSSCGLWVVLLWVKCGGRLRARNKPLRQTRYSGRGGG